MLDHCTTAINHLLAELEINSDADVIVEELEQVYPECKEALSDAFETWTSLQQIQVPEPSPEMDASFYKSLSTFEMDTSQDKSTGIVVQWRSILSYAAVGLLLFSAGAFLGRYFAGSSPSLNRPIQFSGEPITMVSQPHLNTSSKLEIIQSTKLLQEPNDEVLSALNTALIGDVSINVRLSAIEALLHFAEYDQVRSYLIKAIPAQASPIVQIALADALSSLQEKGAVAPLNQMIESGSLRMEVADHFEDAIKILM